MSSETEWAVSPEFSTRTRNLELRRARQSLRLSQAQFAEAIRATGNAVGEPNQCTKRLVQKWENGEHTTCRTRYLVVLQAVTGLPVNELGFRLLPDQMRAPAEGSRGAAERADHEPSSSDGAPVAPGAQAPSVAQQYTEAMIRESKHRLRHALNHPSTVDARTAEFVEMATAQLFDLEHHSPARLLGCTVERHLAMVTALLAAARAEKVRRSLTISAGRTALLAGWLAFDRGDGPSSHELWADALAAAQCTTDDPLFAAVLTCQSYAAARRHDPGTAWQLAHTVASRTPGAPRATAWTSSRVALYAALLGEHKEAEFAMRRSLEIGRQLPNLTPCDDALPWTRSFDEARLLSSSAHTAALLGDVGALDYAMQAVEALGPAKVKSRAVVLAEAALTAAIVRVPELCLDYGSAAAGLALQMDVSVAVDLLCQIVPRVLPLSDSRPIQELLPQLSQLSPRAT